MVCDLTNTMVCDWIAIMVCDWTAIMVCDWTAIVVCDWTAIIVQQPSRHFYLNLAKIPPNQVIADFGRGSSVDSESE